MSNRTLLYSTIVVIAGMLILFGLNVSSILTGRPPNETHLHYNQVRGMAVGYNQLLYTLNFKQQNEVIEILNRSIPVKGINPGRNQPTNVEKIVVYQFDNQPDIIINPIAYVDKNLVFSVPQWSTDGYFREVSAGRLQQLLPQTYDH
jgi:hypothetical protein